jgi:hypothetical protein
MGQLFNWNSAQERPSRVTEEAIELGTGMAGKQSPLLTEAEEKLATEGKQ